MHTAALFTIARTWNQPKRPSTDEWINRMWYIYTMDSTQPTNIVSMVSRKMVLMNLSAGREQRHRRREETCGYTKEQERAG